MLDSRLAYSLILIKYHIILTLFLFQKNRVGTVTQVEIIPIPDVDRRPKILMLLCQGHLNFNDKNTSVSSAYFIYPNLIGKRSSSEEVGDNYIAKTIRIAMFGDLVPQIIFLANRERSFSKP